LLVKIAVWKDDCGDQAPRSSSSAGRPLGRGWAAEAEQQGIEAREVVRVAVADEVHDGHRRVGDGHEPEPAPLGPAKGSQQSRDPHRHEEQTDHHDLEGKKARSATLLAAGDIANWAAAMSAIQPVTRL
jgi:hypothetical protein